MSRTARVAAVVLALAALAAAIGMWKAYDRSPQRTLEKLALASTQGDWNAVKAYLDVTAVSEQIAVILVDERMGDLPSELGDLDNTLAEAAVPLVADRIEEEIRTQVVSRKRRIGFAERVGILTWAASADRVRIQGTKATASVDVPFKGRTYEVEVSLRRSDGGWRVVTVNNIAELIGKERQRNGGWISAKNEKGPLCGSPSATCENTLRVPMQEHHTCQVVPWRQETKRSSL